MNDEKAWEFIAKIKYCKNDYRFIYYIAACCYTDFDYKFYISKDMDRLFRYAVEIPTIKLLRKYKF